MRNQLGRQEWHHDETAGYPGGPWRGEPDKVQWIDEATDLDCLIVRNPAGALCGYVGVPPGHPWHGQDYDEMDVTVHGGLTFASSCNENAPEGHGVCHIPAPGRPDDVWWLGFDCAHGGDDIIPFMAQREIEHYFPPMPRIPGWPDPEYRTIAYVTGQCEQLADQIAAAGVDTPA